MFYYINGTLEYRDASTCVLDCGGGGYKLTVSLNTSDFLTNKQGEKVKLYTHLAVREDGIELFGFYSSEERTCFNQLITVSGVGPKAAISILSTLTPDRFSLAVILFMALCLGNPYEGERLKILNQFPKLRELVQKQLHGLSLNLKTRFQRI